MGFLKVGTVAPAFTLLDQRGNGVSLADYAGKKNVVVYFYPKAMTQAVLFKPAVFEIPMLNLRHSTLWC